MKLPDIASKIKLPGRKKKKWILAGGVLVLIVGGLGIHSYSKAKAAKEKMTAMSQVETTQVTRQDLVDSISVTGTIASADSRDVSAIASNVEVQTVNYKVGDYVNAGDTVVVLDSTDLKLKLTEAQNNQALSTYSLEESVGNGTAQSRSSTAYISAIGVNADNLENADLTLLAGRTLTSQDQDEAKKVILVSDLLVEKYQLNTTAKEPTVIYMERPLKAVSHTIHIEVPPNPFWASIGLSVTPLPLGTGVQYESKVSVGYLNQSFQNAVLDGIRYGLEQGVYGWKVTDCKICFEYGLYYSPVSTPADFRSLAPIVLEQVLKKAGTQLLEPYLSFTLYAPQEYLSRAYHDAPKYCASIETTQVKNSEVIFTGEIPARCVQEYRNDLTFYTNGRSVCLTELKGYQIASGEPVFQPRRPNTRIDKVRHMFNKILPSMMDL